MGRKSNVQLLITGHSIGGGLAQILGMYLKSRTENLLSHLNLKAEPKFAKMLKKTKVYTFSTPFVFLKKQTEELPNDWIALQNKDSYNFINNKIEYFEVKSKSLFRKLWDYFVSWIEPFSLSFAVYIVLGGAIKYGMLGVFTNIILITGISGMLGVILSFFLTIGYSAVLGIYSAVLGIEHLFQAVKNFFSKAHPESINYYSFEAAPAFMLVDQNFLEKQKKLDEHAMCIDDHIKYFFSNASFLNNFKRRKALPAPDQKEETAGEPFDKEETVALVQHEVENLVVVDGDKASGAKKTNDQAEFFPITNKRPNKPSSLEQLGVIAVFILSVIHL